jgi:hypothetical protein
VLRTSPYGNFTFVRPFVVGSTLYVFYETTGVGTGVQESIDVTSATINADCSLTFSGVKKSIIDVATIGIDGWIWPGAFILDGTKIEMTFNYGSTVGAATTPGIYWASYDTATGNVANFTGGTSIAPGSQPVTKAQLDANFLIYTSTNATIASQVKVGSTWHVVFIDYTLGSPFAVSYISNSGSGWSARQTLYTYAGTNSSIPLIGAYGTGVAMWTPDGTGTNTGVAIGAGNIIQATNPSGTWNAATQIATAGAFSLDNPQPVPNGPSRARMTYSQVSSDGLTVPGNLQSFAWGDSINLTRPTFSGPYIANLGPLDVISAGAVVWWATRGYHEYDSQRVFNVCNSGDVACADMALDPATGFVKNRLVGGIDCTAVSTCTIKKVYDHSNNDIDVSQATIANRPLFTASGPSSRVCWDQTASTSKLAATNTFNFNTRPYSGSNVAFNAAAGNGNVSIGINATTAYANMYVNTSKRGAYDTGVPVLEAAAIDFSWIATQTLFNGASSKVVVDGATTSGTLGTNALATITMFLGNDGIGDVSAGKVCEVGYWRGDQSGSFSALNSNQHLIWGF